VNSAAYSMPLFGEKSQEDKLKQLDEPKYLEEKCFH
jgi:hypothetical protein